VHFRIVAGDNAGTFLPSMLQCVKSEINQIGGLRMTIYPYDSAFFM